MRQSEDGEASQAEWAVYTFFKESGEEPHNIKYIRWCSVAKSYLTLWNPMDCSPPGSSVLGIPRQEYWSALPFPSPGDPPCPGIEPASPHLLNCRQILYQWATMDTQYNLTGHNWVDVGSEWEGWKLQEFCLGRHRGEVWAIHCLGAQGSFDCYWCRRCAHQQLVSKRWPGQTFGANTKAILDESSG